MIIKKSRQRSKGYWELLRELSQLIDSADRIIVGMDESLSAPGEAEYALRTEPRDWLPEYIEPGMFTLNEALNIFWGQKRDIIKGCWSYWAKRVLHAAKGDTDMQPYRDLMSLLQGKLYFIRTAATDGLPERAGFPESRIYTPLGDYRYFQCSDRCTDEVVDSRDRVEEIAARMLSSATVRYEDIPKCSHCGATMIPRLHIGALFAEEAPLLNSAAYDAFLHDSMGRSILLVELGVGMRYTSAIRYPFEEMTRRICKTRLVRIDQVRPDVPRDIAGSAVSIREAPEKVLRDLLYLRSRESSSPLGKRI